MFDDLMCDVGQVRSSVMIEVCMNLQYINRRHPIDGVIRQCCMLDLGNIMIGSYRISTHKREGRVQ